MYGAHEFARNGIDKSEKLTRAQEFLDEFCKENQLDQSHFKNRWNVVEEQILQLDHFDLTKDELTFGAKTSWRNASRCSGRSVWKDLIVRDFRSIQTVEEMCLSILDHIKDSFNHGSIKPMITIFPERLPRGPDKFRIWNSQLIQYAGYWMDKETMTVLGDQINVDFTEVSNKNILHNLS